MQSFERRHPRLLKKDEELQKLFDEAAKRRKQILVGQLKSSQIPIENDLQSQKYLLKPLRSTEDLKRERKNISNGKNQLSNASNSRNAYQSCQNLPETNLDAFMEAGDSIPTKATQEVIPFNENTDNVVKSSQHSSFCEINQSRQGHHNSSYISTSISSSSTSSIEIDSNKYCQFFPINTRVNELTSLSPTHSSKFKQISSFDDGMLLTQTSCAQSPEKINDNLKNTDAKCGNLKRESIYDKSKKRPSSVYYYPSGSPLLSNKYQGSPVVRIDDKIRAGDADYLLNCCYECDATATPYYPGDCIHSTSKQQQQPHSSVILSRKPPIPSIIFNKNISNDAYPPNPSLISSIDPSTGCIVSNKPPLLPHKFLSSQHHPPRVKMKLISAIHSQMSSSNNYNMNNSTSQPSLLLHSPVPPSRNNNPVSNVEKSSVQITSINNNQKPEVVDGGNITASTSTLIKRRKKKLLEEHLNKRFSMGDYSTRALIEWDSKLLLEMESEQENKYVDPHNGLYSSGDLANCQHLKLKESMHSDSLYRVSSYTTKNMIADNVHNKSKDAKSQRLHTTSESSIIYCNQCHDSTSSNPQRRRRNIASSSADSILIDNDTNNKTNSNPNAAQQHQVSFCLRTKSADDDDADDDEDENENEDVNSRTRYYFRHHKRHRSISNFLQRSLWDIRGVWRKRNTSSSVNSPFSVSGGASSSHEKMNTNSGFSNGRTRSGFQFRSLKKRQDSITSDQLYSIPPFARKMPPLTSNSSTINPKPSSTLDSPVPIVSSLSSSNTTKSSSSHQSHNFIAQLDPTYNQNKPTNIDNLNNNNHNNEFKRNRSYRCSFIENPDVSTVRKLTNHDVVNPSNDSNNNNSNKKSYHRTNNGSSSKSDAEEIAVSPPRYVVQPKRRIMPPKSVGNSSTSKSLRPRQNTNLLYHQQKSGGGLGTPNSSKVNCAQQ